MDPQKDMPEAWCVLGSEYLFRRPWLTVRCDRVRLPTGAVIDDYYVVEYPPWVNVVAVTRDKRLVLVRQYRHGLGQANYELPAGVVDSGDPEPLVAAKRELAEETGFGGGVWSPLLVCAAAASSLSNLTHSFLAVDVEQVGEPSPEATEDLRVSVLDVTEVRRLIDNGGIVQSLHLAPLLKYLLGQIER